MCHGPLDVTGGGKKVGEGGVWEAPVPQCARPCGDVFRNAYKRNIEDRTSVTNTARASASFRRLADYFQNP